MEYFGHPFVVWMRILRGSPGAAQLPTAGPKTKGNPETFLLLRDAILSFAEIKNTCYLALLGLKGKLLDICSHFVRFRCLKQTSFIWHSFFKWKLLLDLGFVLLTLANGSLPSPCAQRQKKWTAAYAQSRALEQPKNGRRGRGW